MHLLPLASGLSTSLSSAYFPPGQTERQHAYHNPADQSDASIHGFDKGDGIDIKGKKKDIGLLDIILPASPPSSSHTSFLNIYRPTSIVASYSEGILITDLKNASDALFSYSLTTFQTKLIVRLPGFPSNIIYMHNICDFILILTDQKTVLLLDPASGIVLSSLQLSIDFKALKEVVVSKQSGCAQSLDKYIFYLYNTGSYVQFLSLDLKSFQLSFSSTVIFLQFWPVSVLSLDGKIHYLFNAKGNYQVLTCYSSTEFSLSPTNQNLLLTEENYGNLVDITYYDTANSNSVLFLQEKGWIVYQIPEGQKSIASLANLQSLISSPLSSSFQEIIQLKDISYILMVDGNIMSVFANHIHLIESGKQKPLYIFNNVACNTLFGLFNDSTGSKELKYLDRRHQEWKTYNIPSPPKSAGKVISYQDENFVVITDQNRLILQTLSGLELCTLFDMQGKHVNVIDLNVVLKTGDDLNYYIILDSNEVSYILVVNTNFTKVVKLVAIGKEFTMDKITSVYYYEKDMILEFFSSEKSVFFKVSTFELLSSTRKLSNKTKMMIYNCIDKQEQFNTDSEIFADISVINLGDLMLYNDFKFLKRCDWIGIKTDFQIIYYNFEYKLDFLTQSPELFMIHSIIEKEIDSGVIVKLTEKNDIRILLFVKKLMEFSISDNTVVTDFSISTLYSMLSRRIDITEILYKEYTAGYSNSLLDTIMLSVCISINSKLLSCDNSKRVIRQIFKNIAHYVLLLDVKLCTVCMDILKLLKLKDYKSLGTSEDDNFDIVFFFSRLFYARSEFFNSPSNRNFQCFQRCNEVVDLFMKDNMFEVVVVICTIIENDKFTLSDKRCAIDYLNYVFLEQDELLKKTSDFTLLLYLIVNSIFLLLSTPSVNSSHFLEREDKFWETVNLFVNILNSGFNDFFIIKFSGDFRDLIKNRKELSSCLILNKFGYLAIVYTRSTDGLWKMTPLKCSKANIPKLDKELKNDNVDLDAIRTRLAENAATTMTEFLRYPIFYKSCGRLCLCLLNLDRMSVQIWRLDGEVFTDNLNVEILRSGSIPLKVPDWSLVFFQYFWAILNNSYVCADDARRRNTPVFTEVLRQLHHQLSNTGTSPNTRALAPSGKPRLPFSGYTFSDIPMVYEPHGEYDFGFILDGYLQVFPELAIADIGLQLVSDFETPAGQQIGLTLDGKKVFVFRV